MLSQNKKEGSAGRKLTPSENGAASSLTELIRAGLNRQAVYLLVIVFAGLAAYSNTFNVPFQFDDEHFIQDNPVITSLDNFFSSAKGYEYHSRRFITYLTFALNYRFGGFDVTGYHIVNLAIHLINALLVYTLVLLTFRTPAMSCIGQSAQSRAREDTPCAMRFAPSADLIAFFSGLLFAVHPIETQAVTYIYQRLTSLAALFYLLSVAAYAKARLSGLTPSSRPRFTSPGFYVLAVCSAVLAMKTKEIAFTLPITIGLYEFMFFKTGFKRKFIFTLPILLTLAIIPVSIMGTHEPLGQILSDLSEKSRLQTDLPRWDYLMTQMRVITTYIRLLFAPVDQNLDYDYPIYHSLFDPPVFFSFLFLCAIAGTGVYFLRRANHAANRAAGPAGGEVTASDQRCRIAAFGIFWFFITLAVESSVIPIVDVVFEHRLYLPSVGAFVAIATIGLMIKDGLRPVWPRIDAPAAAVAGIAVLALTAACYTRNMVWQDHVTLYRDVVAKSPGKARGHNNLGIAYDDRGMIDEAVVEYRKAVRLSPDYAEAHYNLGVVYGEKGLIEKAIDEYRTALALKPKDALTHNNLGSSYGITGRVEEAVSQFQAAITLKPDYREAHYNLGLIYQSRGLTEKAKEHFRIAERLQQVNRRQ